MHKEYTIRAAKAGKHVIVEKPMALNAKDCEEMIAVCKKNKVQLAVGYRLHYEPFHQELMRLGQEKVFGNVRLIEASLGYRTTNATQWRLKKELAGGGPLMNIGIYAVQVARYVLGEEPESLTAQFGPVTNKKLFSEVEESITWQLNFASGAVANSASTYNTNIDRFYAGAERGFFELSPALSYGPFQGRTSNGVLEFPTINQQTAQMDGISKFILENKPLPEHIAGIEGLKDMKIIDAIYSAALSGKKIDLITV
jgi:predicted dehydrogenase